MSVTPMKSSENVNQKRKTDYDLLRGKQKMLNMESNMDKLMAQQPAKEFNAMLGVKNKDQAQSSGHQLSMK